MKNIVGIGRDNSCSKASPLVSNSAASLQMCSDLLCKDFSVDIFFVDSNLESKDPWRSLNSDVQFD